MAKARWRIRVDATTADAQLAWRGWAVVPPSIAESRKSAHRLRAELGFPTGWRTTARLVPYPEASHFLQYPPVFDGQGQRFPIGALQLQLDVRPWRSSAQQSLDTRVPDGTARRSQV
jgi:hypothetical protein